MSKSAQADAAAPMGENARLRSIAKSLSISVLQRLIANYQTDRDEISDSDLDNEQPIAITFRGTLGDIRNARQALRCFKNNADAAEPPSPQAGAGEDKELLRCDCKPLKWNPQCPQHGTEPPPSEAELFSKWLTSFAEAGVYLPQTAKKLREAAFLIERQAAAIKTTEQSNDTWMEHCERQAAELREKEVENKRLDRLLREYADDLHKERRETHELQSTISRLEGELKEKDAEIKRGVKPKLLAYRSEIERLQSKIKTLESQISKGYIAHDKLKDYKHD